MASKKKYQFFQLPQNNKTLKAVMVLFHSGGHLWGSGTLSQHGSPDYLMHQDIIYVTFNYRLHVFGEFIFLISHKLGIFPN